MSHFLFQQQEFAEQNQKLQMLAGMEIHVEQSETKL